MRICTIHGLAVGIQMETAPQKYPDGTSSIQVAAPIAMRQHSRRGRSVLAERFDSIPYPACEDRNIQLFIGLAIEQLQDRSEKMRGAAVERSSPAKR